MPGTAYSAATAVVSKGMTFKFGSVTVGGVFNVPDLGGTPQGLDCTSISMTATAETAGMMEMSTFEVEYRYNETDFDALDALKGGTTPQALEITLYNGAKFTNNATLVANFVEGFDANTVLNAKCVFNLADPNGWTKVSPTP